MQNLAAPPPLQPTPTSVGPVAGSVLRGPHLLEVGVRLGGHGGRTVHGRTAARHEALQGLGWRYSALQLGSARASPGMRLPWLSAARWWCDRAGVAHTITAARPDVIETAEPFVLGAAVLEAADRLGVPAVALCHGDPLLGLRRGLAHAHGLHPQGPPPRSRWVERRALGLLQRVFEGYDLVLAPSRSMTAQLQALGVLHAAYQPLGIDCTVYTPNAGDHAWRRRLEARLHITPGTRLLLYVGRFSAEMRLDQVAEAVRRLGPGHALLACGEGPMAPVGNAVYCLPDDLPAAERARLMASCDAFVHAGGEAEHCGRAVLEAMACGLPVVVSNAGVLGELADGAGVTVAGAQVETWAEALRSVLGGTSWTHFWSALERARTHDWGAVVHAQTLRYRQALGSMRPLGEGSMARERIDLAQPVLTR